MKSSTLIFLLVIFRLINMFAIKTWFVPDEIFQSVEVAYYSVYGYGHLSWEWSSALRSVLHPAFIAAIFYLLRFLNLDTNYLVIILPRLLHSLIFALSDYYFYLFAKRILLTLSAANYSLFSLLSSWFVWYCASRTLSNSLETALTLIALNWYPVMSENADHLVVLREWPYVSIAVLTIIIRPTAVLLWIPLGLWRTLHSRSPIKLIFYTYIPAALPVILITCILDSFAYHKLTFSTWNFAKFNVFDGGCAHFGVHPWHWYLSQGLVSVITIHILPIVGGIYSSIKHRSIHFIYLLVPFFYIFVHSLLAHKEHRFILPIIPFLCIYSGHFLAHTLRKFALTKRILIFLMLLVNVPLAIYMGLFHQIGPNSALKFIREHSFVHFGSQKDFSVLYLMPCYSMPEYSHFHRFNVSVISLDCTPNLKNLSSYIDESDRFHLNPLLWVNTNKQLVVSSHYLVLYEKVFMNLEEFFTQNNFHVCARKFHTHFPLSQRADNYIIILCSSSLY